MASNNNRDQHGRQNRELSFSAESSPCDKNKPINPGQAPQLCTYLKPPGALTLLGLMHLM